MKTKVQNKKFAEEEVLQVNLKDAEGNPIENEKELTEEQINFAAKMAHAMYKKFSASKVKKFDAEKEEINVILPENIEEVNIDQVATEAAEARDAEASDEVTVTVEDDETPATEGNEEVAKFCNDVKAFAAKMRKFARKSKKFEAEELEPIKEALEEVTDAVEDLVEKDENTPAEPETAQEFCKQFSATLKKLREGKKFSAEDLAEVEKIEGELEDVVEEINDTVVEPEEANADGVGDIKNFTARKIAQQIGAGNLDDFKANFLAGK